MFENIFRSAEWKVFFRMRHSDFPGFNSMPELHMAALLVNLFPAVGLEASDDLVAGHGHGWSIHTNTHGRQSVAAWP